MSLSARLLAVASQVLPGSLVADIGTDQAPLPIYLVRTGICSRVIAVEKNLAPFREADRRVRRADLSGRIDLRWGYGLEVIQPGEIDTVVMAGIGGRTICQILERSAPVTASLNRLILQPMRQVVYLLKWLNAHGWYLQQGDLVAERNHFYEILVAVPGPRVPEPQLSLGGISSILIKQRHPLLPRYLTHKLERYQSILAGAARGYCPEDNARKKKIAQKTTELQEVLQWLL